MPIPKSRGELNEWIVIQSLSSRTPDGIGGYYGSWKTVLETFANIAIKDNEFWLEDKMTSVRMYTISCRYDATIDSRMRVLVFNGAKKLNIKYVVPLDSQNRWMEMSCEEIGQ